MAVGGANGQSVAAVSTQGVSWTPVTIGQNAIFSDITFSDGLFVAVGSNGTIVTSVNGQTWNRETSNSGDFLFNIASGNGTFVIVGRDFGTILTSNNAKDWTTRSGGRPELFNIGYGNGIFSAVGNNGRILQSHFVGPPTLTAPAFLANGSVELSFHGRIERAYRFQRTDTLSPADWIDVSSFTLKAENKTLLDTPLTAERSRFYRVVSP